MATAERGLDGGGSRRRQRGAAWLGVLLLVLAGCAATVSLDQRAPSAAAPPPSPPPLASPIVAPGPATTLPLAVPIAVPPPAGTLAMPPYLPRDRASRPDPSGLRAFDEVLGDAVAEPGFFTLWRRDDRTWLEVHADQLDQPLLLSVTFASGVGDQHLFPGVLAGVWIVTLHRLGNQLQVVARNQAVRAPAGSPLELAVRDSFADSLLASAPIASASSAERKSFLVDPSALFGADVVGLSTTLEQSFRLGYAFDSRNTGLRSARASESGTSLVIRANYSVGHLPATGVGAPGLPNGGLPELPDVRSLLIDLDYLLAPLPPQPMRPRRADQRLGYFTTAFTDLGASSPSSDHTHYIQRWRLEKADPAAEPSPPKEPIVVWLDRDIPERWRDAVRAGVLEWNKAFEEAGFAGALEVREQPRDGDWSSVEGTRHIALRWFATQGPGGQATSRIVVDPRTGEILQASALVSDNWTRLERTAVTEYLPTVTTPAADLQSPACRYEAGALAINGFALSLLQVRGLVAPDGPEADRFVGAGIKDVVMHEIGHALGLRHNFRASATVPLDRLRNPDYVRGHGVSSSVMDYNPLNIPLEGEPASVYHQTTIGAYDRWAIEYGYREFAPEAEAGGLAAIADRSAREPELAYGTDEDAGNSVVAGVDPLINRYDLGNDPLAYYKRMFALARELWRRTERRPVAADDNYLVNRRNLTRGLGYVGLVAPLITKYVGGFYTTRDLAGTGRPLLVPVPADKQREALDALAGELFSIDSFRFDPAFLSRIGVDYLDRGPANDAGGVQFNLAEALVAIQRNVLDTLMSDATAARLAGAESVVADPQSLMSLAELHQRLAAAIWGELKAATHIDSLRRDLQREHLRRIVAALVHPPSKVAADTRAVQRQVAERLSEQLKRALANPKLDDITRAHLRESQDTVDEALRAAPVKQPG